MSDLNNNNNEGDNWSNRNWQDASNFTDNNRQSFGKTLFDSTFRGQGFNGNAFNTRGDDEGYTGYGKIGSGWLSGKNSMTVVIVVLVIIIIYTFYTQTALNSGVTQSTIQRTKIESGTFDPKNDDFYYDEYGAVEDDRALASATQYFYNKTGVIPYVYFSSSNEVVPEAELNIMAENFYKEHFNDQNHFMICLDTKTTSYTMGYFIGDNARSVLDDEAVQIFKDFLDKYYMSRQTENQTYMVNTYRYCAERIMTTLPFSIRNVVFGGIAIIVLIAVIIYYIKKRLPEEKASA